MVNMTSASVPSRARKLQDSSVHSGPSLESLNSGRNSVMMDEYSDDDEEQGADTEQEVRSTHVGSRLVR